MPPVKDVGGLMRENRTPGSMRKSRRWTGSFAQRLMLNRYSGCPVDLFVVACAWVSAER
jgi:hypothetical protein